MIFSGLIKNFAPVEGINFDPVLLAFQARVSEYSINRLMEPAGIVIGNLGSR